MWVKYLLTSFPLTEISFIVSGANFVVAAATLGYFLFRGSVAFPKLSVGAMVLAAIALAVGFAENRSWSVSIEQQLYDAPIRHSETSKYQRIVMTHDSKTGDWRLYLNGGLQFSSVDEAIYHEHLVHPAMALAPKREKVLILGGGDGLALREVLKYKDVRAVTLVDIDEAVIRFAATDPTMRRLNGDSFADARVFATASLAVSGSGYRHVRTGPPDDTAHPRSGARVNVSVVTIDAFKYVTDIGGGPWDVVIIDFPDPDQVELAKLYSREFYRSLRRIVSPEALIAVQSTSPYHAKEAFLCIGRTIADAGYDPVPYHANVPSFGDWGWHLFSPSKSEQELSGEIALLRALPIETAYLTPETVTASLSFGRSARSAAFDGVTTVMEPHVLHYYTQYAWQRD